MRLVIVYYLMNDAGSAQDIHNYTRVAQELGHEVVVYGRDPESRFQLSKDLNSTDAVVFIFEWTTKFRSGDQLDLVRLLEEVPREKRIVIDCDGAYNERISVGGDYNHRDEAASQHWLAVCDSLSDKVFQPTFRPRRPNVGTFFFHAYDPAWERPLDFSDKEYAMVYVGHSKFRWGPMRRILKAIEPVRESLGRIAFVGHGWGEMPDWAATMKIEDQFYTDKDYMAELNVEFVAPVPFYDVIPWMSKAIFSPVIYRPLFRELGFVTCRTFETPAANTIPLFGLDEDYVEEIFGPAALELVLPDNDAEQKIEDIVARPRYYADIVREIRLGLRRNHSYVARMNELIQIVHSNA